jgi:hypothetical protein
MTVPAESSAHVCAGSGASSGGTGIAGSGGGINCAAVKCAGAVTKCAVNQPMIPEGQCCPVCVCPQACAAASDVVCAQGVMPNPASTDPNVCCPQPVCPSALCVGKQCGASCATGEVPALCDAIGNCITGGSPICQPK